MIFLMLMVLLLSILVGWFFHWLFFPWIMSDVKYIYASGKMLQSNAKLVKENLKFPKRLSQVAKSNPEKPFVLYLNEKWTYSDMDNAVNKLSRVLLSLGVKKEDKVAVLMYNEPMYIAMVLACMKIGVKPALLNNKLCAQPLLHCIDVVKPKFIITGKDEDLIETVEEIQVDLAKLNATICTFSSHSHKMTSILSSFEKASSDDLAAQESVDVGWNDTAVYIYTSGTTGRPKAVKMSHKRLIGGSGIGCLGSFRSDDILYCALPLYHTAGLMAGVLTVLRFGATVALRQRFSASNFFDDCRKYKVTIIQYIGETLRYLCNQPERANDCDHCIRLAMGNGLRPDVWKTFLLRFGPDIRVLEFYAATESNANYVNWFNKVGYVGKCTPLMKALTGHAFVKYDWKNQQPYRDNNGRCVEVKLNEPGLLIAKVKEESPYLKYLGPEELTNAKLLSGVFELKYYAEFDFDEDGDKYYNSGDLLSRNDDYWVSFVDRIGDTFRWKGENVSTNEVNDIIAAFPGISEVNTYGVKVPGHDGRVGMVALVLDEDAGLDTSELFHYVSKNLPSYARPVFLRIMDSMDVTGTMKLQKPRVQDEGYNKQRCGDDPLFFCDTFNKAYVPLTHVIVTKIEEGAIKL